ncbi:MAG: AAA family ATPase [Alphaproteobacteria bacterium]|nr:AAA family ATPase [Alphaproteobacteria bacterium]
MIIEDQSSLIKALSVPETFGLKSNCKILIKETNISELFMTGDLVYKLKRGVKYPYVDYSTVEKRKKACENEKRLCDLWAPGLSHGVYPIRLTSKGYRVGNVPPLGGEIVDYLFVMKEFPEDMLFDRLTDRGDLDRFEMMDTAERIYEMHKSAKIVEDRDPVEIIKGRIVENNAMIRCFVPSIFDAEDVDELENLQIKALNEVKDLLYKRGTEGKIRYCHGDLNLRNIAMYNGKVTLFNPIEFYDDLVKIDTLYDFAFLLVDMESKGLRRLVSILFNHYMSLSGDWDGVLALPLFLSCRAAVNAYVFAERSSEIMDKPASNLMANRAYEQFVLAKRFLKQEKPILVACGGLSGSGKSRISREAAPYIGNPIGAVILRDDVIRKNLLKIDLEDYIPTDTYTDDQENLVFKTICEQCVQILKNGQSVVVDALFHNEKQRELIEKIARDLHIKFQGIWVDAPIEIRKERVMKRLRNPSDVKSPEELDAQLNIDVGYINWEKIDTSGDKMTTLSSVRSLIAKI